MSDSQPVTQKEFEKLAQMTASGFAAAEADLRRVEKRIVQAVKTDLRESEERLLDAIRSVEVKHADFEALQGEVKELARRVSTLEKQP